MRDFSSWRFRWEVAACFMGTSSGHLDAFGTIGSLEGYLMKLPQQTNLNPFEQ